MYKKGIRISYLANTSVKSGAEIALVNLLQCVKDEYDVRLIAGQHGYLVDAAREINVKTTVINLEQKVNNFRKRDSLNLTSPIIFLDVLRFIWKLRKYLKATKPEILHCNTTKANILGSVAAIGLPVKVVWHLRDLISKQNYGPLSLTILKMTTKLADHFVANSNFTLSEFLSTFKVRQGTSIIPSSVIYDLAPEPRKARNLPDNGEKLIIGSVSRISPWKGQDVFLRAVPKIRIERDFEIWIIGGALFGEANFEKALVNLAIELGIRDKVVFFGHQEDLTPFWKEMDIFVHSPVTPEPFGQVIVEAQANGIPVIVPRSGGSAEWIVNQKNGLFFESGDCDSLSDKISLIGGDPLLYRILSQGGIEITKQFNPNVVLNEIMKIYLEVGLGR